MSVANVTGAETVRRPEASGWRRAMTTPAVDAPTMTASETSQTGRRVMRRDQREASRHFVPSCLRVDLIRSPRKSRSGPRQDGMQPANLVERRGLITQVDQAQIATAFEQDAA